MKVSKLTLDLLGNYIKPFIHVCCGARSEVSNCLVDAVPHSRYVGFEPDEAECASLCQQAKAGYSYLPVALGKTSATRRLYITKNPNCSSLLFPNYPFFCQFMDIAPQIQIREVKDVQTVALDLYLPKVEINHIDFLQLDTQGTELEILHGAEKFLSSCVLGLKVEVEFSPLYKDQPLFADIDTYVRQFGFMLFDMSRNRYRRQNYPRDLTTRGQLLWGDAFYLKDYNCLADKESKQAYIKLAIIAIFYGFHDYALEIVDFLLQGGAGTLNSEGARLLQRLRSEYMSSLVRKHWLIKLIEWLEQSSLRGFSHGVRAVIRPVTHAFVLVKERRNYSWED